MGTNICNNLSLYVPDLCINDKSFTPFISNQRKEYLKMTKMSPKVQELKLNKIFENIENSAFSIRYYS